MAKQIVGVVLVIVLFIAATVAYKAWQKKVLREEYERFKDDGEEPQDSDGESLDTSS